MKHIKLFEQFDDYDLEDIFGKDDAIIYNELFTNFLRENGIYDEFLYEVRQRIHNENASLDDINNYIKERLSHYHDKEREIGEIINASLQWSKTKSGGEYWEKLHNRWQKYIYINK